MTRQTTATTGCEPRDRSVVRRLAPVLLVLLAVAACESVVGGGAAEFEVLVVPDGDQGVEVEGSLTTTLRISLRSSDGFPVDISAGEQEVTLDLQQPTAEELGTVTVLPGIFQGVTVYFSEVEGQIESGGEIVPVRVDFGGEERLEKEDATQRLARSDERLAVTVDLSVSQWLEAAEVDGPDGDLVVPAAAFLDAVRIVMEPR